MSNVKSNKPLKNKESRVLGGSRLIDLVLPQGLEPWTPKSVVLYQLS